MWYGYHPGPDGSCADAVVVISITVVQKKQHAQYRISAMRQAVC